MMELPLSDYLAAKLLEDVRAQRAIPAAVAGAVYRYPHIDLIRGHVTPKDCEAIVRFAEQFESDLASWSFAVGGLLLPIRTDTTQRWLIAAWHQYPQFERRYHLAYRLLDYETLEPSLQSEIWSFVQANLHRFIFERQDWYGGAEKVLESARARLDDPRFPATKKWLYLISAAASANRRSARKLIESQLGVHGPLTDQVATYLIERWDELTPQAT